MTRELGEPWWPRPEWGAKTSFQEGSLLNGGGEVGGAVGPAGLGGHRIPLAEECVAECGSRARFHMALGCTMGHSGAKVAKPPVGVAQVCQAGWEQGPLLARWWAQACHTHPSTA